MRPRHALTLVLFLAAAGCAPELKGTCTTTADCPSDTYCDESVGLCLVADVEGDGGTVAPSDAGTKIDAGTKVDAGPQATASIEITSPADGDLFGGGLLEVKLRVAASSAPQEVEVGMTGSGVDQTVAAAASGPSGEYVANQNLGAAAITTGDYELVAHVRTATARASSDPVRIRVDRSGPVITLTAVSYPTRAAGHPATGAFLRNEEVVVDASVADRPAGLGDAPPTLEISGMTDVVGVARSGGVFRFTFPASKPPFPAFAGDLAFRIRAEDRVGNASTHAGAVRITRHAWRFAKQRGGRISAAPALWTDRQLTAPLVVFGAGDNFVYAVRRADGSLAWERNVEAKPVGHITAGEVAVYAATEAGRVHALAASAAPLTEAARQLWRCPDGRPGDGQAFDLGAGVALAKTVANAVNPTLVETLVGVTLNGRLRLFRGQNFPTVAGDAIGSGCSRYVDLQATTAASVPVLTSHEGVLTAYVGTRPPARNEPELGRVRIRTNNGFTFLDEDAWGEVGDDVLGPIAIGQRASGPFLLVGRADARLRAFDFDLDVIWSPAQDAVAGELRASPAIAGGFDYVVSQAGRLQKISVETGNRQWSQPFNGEPRTTGAMAGPVVARDGRTYLAHGPRLSAIGPEGAEEWAFDTRPAGQLVPQRFVDALTPVLGCDGLLFLAENDATTGTLNAFITDSPGLAQDAWPRPGHDVRNTFNAATPLAAGGACVE